MGAIILLDRALQEVQGGLLFAAISEKRSLVVPRLGVGLGGEAGFRFLRHSIQVRGRAQLKAGLQQVSAITRRGWHALHSFAGFFSFAFAEKN